MAPKVKGMTGARKPLENGNEEAIVSSTSVPLNGEFDAAVSLKSTTEGRKVKKEASSAKKEKAEQKLSEKEASTGRGRGRKKATATAVIPELVEEGDVPEKNKKPVAKGRSKKLAINGDSKATQNAGETVKSDKIEKVSVKKGQKAVTTDTVAKETNNKVAADSVVPQKNEKESKAPAKRSRRLASGDATVQVIVESKGRGRPPKQTTSAAVYEAVTTDNEVPDTKVVSVKKRTSKKLAQEIEIKDEIKAEYFLDKTTPKEAKKKNGKSSTSAAKDEPQENILLEAYPEEKPVKSATKRKAAKERVAAEIVQPGADETSSSRKKKAKKTEEVGEKQTKPSSKSKKLPKAQENNTNKALENGVEKEKKPRGRKRALVADDDAATADGAKPTKTKKTATVPLNSTSTKYNKADFALTPTDGEIRYNFKISSWNVAGLRSWLKKDGLRFLEYEEPDIFCLQEIKCTIDQLPEEVARIPGYHPYWLCMPGGYAGVAIYSKIMPIHVEYGIGNEEFDDAGRIITAEYEKFYLINVYVPNSGRKLVNLQPRMRWEKLFQSYVQRLEALKPVIICGDMNVSHQEIDLANPKTNTRNAGFTKEERDKMTELLSLGYVDTYRHLYPTRTGAYTFWTYMGNARARNVGWRLDYFIVSERFIKRVVDNCMRTQVMGSDHCPTTLFLKM